MLRYGYFDSEIIGTDEEGMPIFDRAESSDLFRLLFSKLVSNGVLASPGNCFQVIAGEGLNVKVNSGFGMVNGAFAYDDSEKSLTLEKAPTQYSRIDRVVLRANYAERLCEIVVKTGEAAATPTAPELLQPNAGDYFELSLATILVGQNVTEISQSAITDTRGNSAVCGYVTQLIDHLDTSTFYAQLDKFYAEFVSKTESDYQESREKYMKLCQDIVTKLTTFESGAESDFNAWFDQIKGQLSTDQAGHLQNQINTLAANVHELRTYGASLEQEVAGVKKDISDKHSTGIVEIPANKWSGTPSQISGRDLYTAEVKVKNIFDNVPEIGLYPANKVPTEAEQEVFNKIKYANADTATAKVTLYAEEKPTVAIKVIIKGVTV